MEANAFESIRLLVYGVAFHSDVCANIRCHITKLELIYSAGVSNFILGWITWFWRLAKLLTR